MTLRVKVAAALSAGMLLCGSVALAQDYIFDIKQRNPAIIRPWVQIVPPVFANHPWIRTLDGTTGPSSTVNVDNGRFYIGSVCWPHNCGGNTVVYLLALDGSRAYGLLRSETLGINDLYFGAPHPGIQAVLLKYMNTQ